MVCFISSNPSLRSPEEFKNQLKLSEPYFGRLKRLSGKTLKKLSSHDLLKNPWKTAAIITLVAYTAILACSFYPASTQNTVNRQDTPNTALLLPHADTHPVTNLTCSRTKSSLILENPLFPTCSSYEDLEAKYEILKQKYNKDLTLERNRAHASELRLKEFLPILQGTALGTSVLSIYLIYERITGQTN